MRSVPKVPVSPMRRLAAALCCVLIAGPAAAQPAQDSQPSGQTLLKNLMGNKNQTSPFDSHPQAETEEQRQHYVRKNPDEHSGSSSTMDTDHR
jgi:hypothetical protein